MSGFFVKLIPVETITQENDNSNKYHSISEFYRLLILDKDFGDRKYNTIGEFWDDSDALWE